MKENNKKNLKRLLISATIFIAVCFFLDFVIGKTLNWLYFSQESGLQYRTTYALEDTNAEVIILGSSRANHHYVPAVFSHELEASSYNAGRDGTSVFYHYAILKGILKRYEPNVIILDILRDEFEFRQDSYDRLSELLPYYDTHPEIQDIVELKSSFEKYKLVSNIYPFNSSLLTILIGNTDYNKKRQNDIQGYIPLSGSYTGSLNMEVGRIHKRIDTNKVEYFKAFLLDCKNMNIQVYIVISPYLIQSDQSETMVMAEAIAKQYAIPFLNFSADTSFLEKRTYFSDPEHLNSVGAELFSNMLVDVIQENSDQNNERPRFRLGSKMNSHKWKPVEAAYNKENENGNAP